MKPLTFQQVTKTVSPIGIIPIDFPHMSELCRKAYIRYTDDEAGRTWSIVANKEIIDNREISTTNNYIKFAMFVDYIAFKNPTYTRTNILLASIGKLSSNVEINYENMSVREVRDFLVADSVTGYEFQSQKSQPKRKYAKLVQ